MQWNIEVKVGTIIWYFVIQTDRKINRNWLFIVVNNYKRKTYLLIDMAVPTDNKISIKEYNKTSKYKEMEIEIEKIMVR